MVVHTRTCTVECYTVGLWYYNQQCIAMAGSTALWNQQGIVITGKTTLVEFARY